MANIFFTDDPVRDWDRKCEEEDEWLAKLPVCDDCGEHIQDGYYYSIAGEIVCPDCIDNYRKTIYDD